MGRPSKLTAHQKRTREKPLLMAGFTGRLGAQIQRQSKHDSTAEVMTGHPFSQGMIARKGFNFMIDHLAGRQTAGLAEQRVRSFALRRIFVPFRVELD
jgi:hypothetical protein